jgi:uncharacterized protein YxeA
VKKILIIIMAVLFIFALAAVSQATEKKIKTTQPVEKPAVKETLDPVQDTTKEEIKADVSETDTDESDGDGEEEEEKDE